VQDLRIFVRHIKPGNVKVQKRCNPSLNPTHEAFSNKHVPRRQKCSNKRKLHSCASECQAHVQLADFPDSENHNWIVAYCKFLPQTEGQWRTLADEATCPQDPTTQEARLIFAEDDVVPRECTRGHGVMHHAAPYGFVGTRSCTFLSDVCNSIIVSTLLL
jgi:hypothetical protein